MEDSFAASNLWNYNRRHLQEFSACNRDVLHTTTAIQEIVSALEVPS